MKTQERSNFKTLPLMKKDVVVDAVVFSAHNSGRA